MSITGDMIIDYEMATCEEFLDYYEEKYYDEFDSELEEKLKNKGGINQNDKSFKK